MAAAVEPKKAETRQDQLDRLERLTEQVIDEEAAKKRDAKLHADHLKDLKDEVKELMQRLKGK